MSASLYCPLLLSHKAGFSLFNTSYFSDLNITVAYFKGISKPTVFLHRYLYYCLSSGYAGLLSCLSPPLLPSYVCGKVSLCSNSSPESRVKQVFTEAC